MNKANITSHAAEEDQSSAEDYLAHARAINKIARMALGLDSTPRVALNIEAKASIGLSLQAAKLAGRSILRSLGRCAKEIRLQQRGHDLLGLLRFAENEIEGRCDARLNPFRDFLLRVPKVEDQEFTSTIDCYFHNHFAQGQSAFARNCFYPDVSTWTGPKPIQAVYFIVEQIIDVAEGVNNAI